MASRASRTSVGSAVPRHAPGNLDASERRHVSKIEDDPIVDAGPPSFRIVGRHDDLERGIRAAIPNG